MTPQELDNLRDRARLTNTFSAFDIAALLDHIEAQEKALQAADKMRVELGKRNWSQMGPAEMEYDAARKETL